MSYVSNQYNYATPASEASNLINEEYIVEDAKHFTLANNTLDGTYHPVSDDAGLWGTSLSASDGSLAEPLVITVTDNVTVHAFRLIGCPYNYPVAFNVEFYNGSNLLYTITEASNSLVEYIHYMSAPLVVSHYIVTVTRISSSNDIAMVHNLYNPGYLRRRDAIKLYATALTGDFDQALCIVRADTVRISADASDDGVLLPFHSADTLSIKYTDKVIPTNVHTKMKDPSRRIYGKVYITFIDPLLDSQVAIETNMDAYNSNNSQTIDGTTIVDDNYFTLYDNDLSGNYKLMSEYSQVGWVSGQHSGADGTFDTIQYIRYSFPVRHMSPFAIYFDDSKGNVAEDFVVDFEYFDGTTSTIPIVGNTAASVLITPSKPDNIVSFTVRVSKVTKPGFPVVIVEADIRATMLYEGYDDHSTLMSIDLLEELTYQDEVEALGGMSANEVTIVLDNSDSSFYFNNPNSTIARRLKRNRRIEPYLGTEVVPGEIEWHKLGTYWSYSWKVPVGGLTATVVAFDTIGLLGSTPFTEHQLCVNMSLGELIEYVLLDARKFAYFLSWKIDPALYEVHIPYAWFEPTNHAAALRRISQAYPMHIYCDRDGNICAAPQKLRLDHFYDVWSDSTNVISKEYNSLYTALPNIVNVTVHNPKLSPGVMLVDDNLAFNVATTPTRTLNFSAPFVSDAILTIEADHSVQYAYKIYSWGIVINFTGTGNVRRIQCAGIALDTSSTSTLTRRNEDSIIVNGTITRDIAADFIQTAELANLILDRIDALSEHDKYDVQVQYRGDIALSINDPILLENGIAPDNRYNIRRHQLTWNGALHGTADLNT